MLFATEIWKEHRVKKEKKKKNKQFLTYMLAINLDAVTVPACMWLHHPSTEGNKASKHLPTVL